MQTHLMANHEILLLSWISLMSLLMFRKSANHGVGAEKLVAQEHCLGNG